MSTNLLGELVANNGTYFLSSNQTYFGKIDQIIVRGNSVYLEEIFVIREGVEVNVASEYFNSPELPDGLRITPQNNEVFSKVYCNVETPTGSGLELVLAS